MAGSAKTKDEALNKSNKRKPSFAHDKQKPSKSSHKKTKRKHEQQQQQQQEGCVVEERETQANMEVESEKGHQWRNLDLVLSIQSKELDAHKKVELFFDFVRSRENKEDTDAECDLNVLSMPQLVTYTSNWIQSLLITSERKIRAGDKGAEEPKFCLDYRCWEIFRFCLVEASKLHVSLSLSRDILRVISCVAGSALDLITSLHADTNEYIYTTSKIHFYKTTSDCMKVLFSSHGRSLNGNLDLWAVAVNSMVELVIKVYGNNLQESDVGIFITQFSCVVLDPFSKFLRVHPGRKNGYRDFVDKVLAHLLHLLGLLHEQGKGIHGSRLNLLKLVEEIVSYGLFHSVHLDEYLSFNSTVKYNSSDDGKLENARTKIKSYHRHLFDQLDNLISEGKVQALAGIGEMFRLFVDCVKEHRKESLNAESSRVTESQATKHLTKIGNLISDRRDLMSTPSLDMRKSIFDFFVLTLEPLLLDLKKHLQVDLQAGTSLQNVYYALKSVNKIISVMVYERVYLRIEGDFGGACLNFFKIIYGLLMSCYAKFNQFWLSIRGMDKFPQVEICNSLAKEFILVVGNFLEMEYEVISDDLMSTWLMIISCLSLTPSSRDASLFSGAVDLGCRVLNVYSEIRQVNHAVFTLCRGLRLLSFYQADDGKKYCELLTSNSSVQSDKFANSGHLLLCSQKFRVAICNAIRSIPEGEVSGCIQTLTDDISDSLAWMKVGSSMTDEYVSGVANSCRFNAQAELFGMVLSEIYSIVLDSLSVTAGNSYHVGVSVKNLINVLRGCMSHIVAPEQDGAIEFLSSVMGITFQSNKVEFGDNPQNKVALVLVFFFRLYVSCRSLYRQAVSLMPPDSSKKMSTEMADFYTAYSGQDFMERTDLVNEGYFSWITRPSASLLSVVRFIKDSFLQEGSVDYSCSIYVMFVMAFQRLVDLNRQIQSAEYIVQKSENVLHSKSVDDADLLTLRKNKKKQKKLLSGLMEEAAGLTEFIMDYLSLVDGKQLLEKLSETPTNSSTLQQMEFDYWDLAICTVNEKTLPTATWWIICQNIDIWCNHATEKKMKLFLSLLIIHALPQEHHTRDDPDETMKVTKHHISWEHLQNTNLYDQKFVCRYMASRLCKTLKKCVSLLFKDSTNIDAELTSSDWTKVLHEFQNSSIAVRDKPVTSYCSYSELLEECCKQKTSFSLISSHVGACQTLLDLFCNMMERSLSFKSFSRCVMCLVNFERLVVGRLVDPHGTLCLHGLHELLGLLVSCRRALKYLLIAFCEEKPEASKSLNIKILCGSSSPVLWLSKSVNLVVAWWSSLSSANNSGQVNDKIFSLMDNTSYVFFTLCKHQFSFTIHSILRPRSSRVSYVDSGGDLLNESDCGMNAPKDAEVCEGLTSIVEILKDQTKSFLLSLKEVSSNGDDEFGLRLGAVQKLSPVVSCTQGLLWGCLSALSDIGASCTDLKARARNRKNKIISVVNSFIDLFVEIIGISSQIFICSNQPLETTSHGEEQLNLDNDNDVRNDPASYGMKMRLQSINDSCIGGLTNFSSFDHNCLRFDLLQSFLTDQNLEAAYFLREILIASSAILRLSNQIGCSHLPCDLIRIFVGCSEVLLLKFSSMVERPKPLSFIWLDGTLKFLEALGSHLPSTTPATTIDVYDKLVDLQLKAIGRCISLQGKGATLASHDIESSVKVFSERQVSESTVLGHLYGLDELKARLRTSLKVLVERPSEQHLLSAVQALERGLVGVREGYTTIYEVKRESGDGGTISSMVAAGVDCLDLILEFVKGQERLNLIKRHINSLMGSLFNIITHLQGPTLFYTKPDYVEVNRNPDPGAVVLMCVEVLTRVAAKQALFHLDYYHVGQSLHIPATLFQVFCNLRTEKSSHPSLLKCKDNNEYEHTESQLLVDRQFSVSLYAASCRLLWTVVKHRKSDCVRCIALLQTSLQALLHSLEIVIVDSADKKGYFTWQVEEAVKCASYLRRVYEEIRQQRDVLGQHCFLFLSEYISVYSGNGPLKRGFKREVDEALRPGVYALIDVCSTDDLQYLHTVFGEGPCRSTLASIQHDYKLHFQYEGKV